MGRKISVSVSVDIDMLDKIEDAGYTPTEVFAEGMKHIENRPKKTE